MAKVKAPNYSAEAVQRLQEVYDPTASEDERNAMVNALVSELQKKRGSIIAKLVNMDLYVKKAVTSKVTGGDPAKKVAIATTLANLVEENFERPKGVSPINPATFEKANKTDLSTMTQAYKAALDCVADLEYQLAVEKGEIEPVDIGPTDEIVADEVATES